MTRQQLKNSGKIMKKSCMPKNDVTEEKVGKIEQGVFIAEHNVMCYIACVYKLIQVVKNERLNKASITKQIDILYPQDLKESVKRNVASCVEIQYKYEDPCEGIFYSTKCLYEADPPNFIFP
ncbi:PREDICTED: general odorant-binding protein 19a-like [Papilio polytes]|uniref:general odorant-binding protein 19a-like n=1 Tax=Papilio polytes TaxID=76194 RepID=UPI0006761F28|nr:PREDICTED: general odorant-binding protein 19a-like [Papilio polytes]